MCIGITDGQAEIEDQLRLPDWRRSAWGVRFGIDQGIVCEKRDDLDLVLEGYEPIPPSEKYPKVKLFVMKLLRKDGRLVWQGMARNTDLLRAPQLRWLTIE